MTTLKRPNLQVVYRILGALHGQGAPLSPTKLQLVAGVNYTQLQRYLELLEDRRLIESVDGSYRGGSLVKLTSEGFRVLNQLTEAMHALFDQSALSHRPNDVVTL